MACELCMPLFIYLFNRTILLKLLDYLLYSIYLHELKAKSKAISIQFLDLLHVSLSFLMTFIVT